jgi:PIN domain nuclease of toxin-antitoxin system
LHDPKHLGKRLQHELRNAANELWLSPISTWEALMLNAKGRIRLHGDLTDWITKSTAPFREAPLTHEIALTAMEMKMPHQDPADRFLAATAKVLDLTLTTADVNLLGLGEVSTLANR